jgi:phosphate uptake regulator
METRKVQMTGGSSYVITLPKEWITSLKIKKNDPLGVEVQPDGTLIITPRTSEDQVQKTKVIDIDGISNPKYLFRQLIGTYIRGYKNINIKSKNEIDPHMRNSVMKFTQILIGPEVVEEDSRTIVIKDLLSPTEMPFDKTVKRMYLLVRNMHESAVTALYEGDKELAADVEERDRDVDRLQWLIARQANMVLEDVTLAKKMGVMQNSATYYFSTSRILERVGDHAVIIANNVPVLIDKKLGDDVLKNIASASGLALNILSNSMEAWGKRDIQSANRNIENVKELAEYCERINDHAMNIRGEAAIALSYVSESIRRTAEYAGDLSELLINQLIGD